MYSTTEFEHEVLPLVYSSAMLEESVHAYPEADIKPGSATATRWREQWEPALVAANAIKRESLAAEQRFVTPLIAAYERLLQRKDAYWKYTALLKHMRAAAQALNGSLGLTGPRRVLVLSAQRPLEWWFAAQLWPDLSPLLDAVLVVDASLPAPLALAENEPLRVVCIPVVPRCLMDDGHHTLSYGDGDTRDWLQRRSRPIHWYPLAVPGALILADYEDASAEGSRFFESVHGDRRRPTWREARRTPTYAPPVATLRAELAAAGESAALVADMERARPRILNRAKTYLNGDRSETSPQVLLDLVNAYFLWGWDQPFLTTDFLPLRGDPFVPLFYAVLPPHRFERNFMGVPVIRHIFDEHSQAVPFYIERMATDFISDALLSYAIAKNPPQSEPMPWDPSEDSISITPDEDADDDPKDDDGWGNFMDMTRRMNLLSLNKK